MPDNDRKQKEALTTTPLFVLKRLMMKNIVVALVLVFFASPSFCQLGVVGGVKSFNVNGWNPQFKEPPYPLAGWQVGLDYWFRLKKRRIEFVPELNFSKHQKDFQSGKLEHSALGLQFNVDFYVFDLASDCNCPTFSKDGSLLSKGFFMELSPSVIVAKNKSKFGGPIYKETVGTEVSFGGSIGVGLDFGFSDMFTITPIARFYYFPNFDWNDEFFPVGKPSDLTQILLGIRLRLYFDEIGKPRYR